MQAHERLCGCAGQPWEGRNSIDARVHVCIGQGVRRGRGLWVVLVDSMQTS